MIAWIKNSVNIIEHLMSSKKNVPIFSDVKDVKSESISVVLIMEIMTGV